MPERADSWPKDAYAVDLSAYLSSFLRCTPSRVLQRTHAAVLRGNALDLIREVNVDHQRLDRSVSGDPLQIVQCSSVDQIVGAEEVPNGVNRQVAVLAGPQFG